jgi:hypothetical protein
MTRTVIAATQEIDARLQVPELIRLALRGLSDMFDENRRLFCFRMVSDERGMVREGISHRYTLISLLGLHQAQLAGHQSPVDIRLTIQELLRDTNWITNIGDLGLLVWLCAEAMPERLLGIDAIFDLKRALVHFGESRRRRTMELAWFLTGLAHQNLKCPEELPHLRSVAVEAYELLTSNQGERGTFSHLAETGGWAGLMRGRLGSFADQIYPIYALSKFSQAYQQPRAAERALACAQTLCELQGPSGQWWWHYDAPTGKVLGCYPVYSVHQHGMAPMGLIAIGDATQIDFSPWIFKGLRWICGENELEYDMRSTSANVVWRSIYRTDYLRHCDTALALLVSCKDSRTHNNLAILRECWPYELGWLLYSWANPALQMTSQPHVPAKSAAELRQ